MRFVFSVFFAPLLVGLLVALFEYWLNTKNKK
ncbi:type I toxin-antitoxin system Fst family toxin [Enterococcus hulanensis]|nr:type I toxin-antitoxin system Fst family toxin [Enterococcus hulanensis]